MEELNNKSMCGAGPPLPHSLSPHTPFPRYFAHGDFGVTRFSLKDRQKNEKDPRKGSDWIVVRILIIILTPYV